MGLYTLESTTVDPATGKEYKIISNDSELGLGQYAEAIRSEDGEDVILAKSFVCEQFRKNTKFGRFIIYHELGHIINEHTVDDCDNYALRLSSLQADTLYYKERDADIFAAKILGKDAAIEVLDFIKSTTTSEYDLKELDLRICNLRDFNI